MSRDRDDDTRGRGRDDDRDTRRSSRDDDGRPARGRGRDDDASSGFKYRSRDPEKTRQRSETGGNDNDPYFNPNVPFLKLAEGDNDYRILPPTWEEPEHFGYDAWVHYSVGPDRNTYLCLNKMRNKACPICEARALAVTDGDSEYADELKPQRRVLSYAVDRGRSKTGLQLNNMSGKMDQDLLRLCVDKKTGESLEIDHPDKGYDISIHRDGQGLKTRYTGMQIARRSSPLDDDKALAFAVEHPIPDQLIYYSYDHIKKAFRGGAPSSSRDDDDRPAARKPTARDDDDDRDTRRSSRDDDDKAKARKPELPTWDEVHDMKFRALSDLVAEHRLKIDPESSRDDDELADMICEALDISKRKASRDDDDRPARGGSTRATLNERPTTKRDDPADESPRERLRRLREEG